MLINREVILAKIESTYNTDSSPGAGDGILIEAPSWTHENASMVERAVVKGTLGKHQSIYAGNMKGVSFDVEIKGSGAAGTAPEVGPLLRACSLGETIVGSTSVTYATVSDSQESITLYYYSDGLLHKITGAMGNASFDMSSNGIGKINFTFLGHDAGHSDASLVSGSYDATVPPPIINVPFSIGGYSAAIAALSMDLGNSVTAPPDMSSSDGFGDVIINARDVSGSFDPAQVLIAQKDFIGEWKAGTTGSLTTGVIGSSAGNRYALTCPAAYYREVSPGDREGLRTYEIGFAAAEVSGDDEFSLVFT